MADGLTPPLRQTVVRVARLPVGVPLETDFVVSSEPVPEPAEGEFLARSVYLSLDPHLRGRLSGRHLGPAVTPGDVMPGHSLAQVAKSRHPGFREGEYVVLDNGWAEWAVSTGRGARRVDPSLGPLSTSLGVLGMPGLTAWAGVSEIVRLRPGDTFLVSAAAGPVGATAGQLARIAGCRAIGIAGSEEKCRHLKETFGFDEALNYKAPDFASSLRTACAPGVDAYFDNVGGPLLESALSVLAIGGAVVMCGLISQYNAEGRPPGLNLGLAIAKRARLLSLVVYDHEDKYDAYLRRASEWVRSGRLRYLEDRAFGLAAAPAAFARLMRGDNVGKSLVVVGAERA